MRSGRIGCKFNKNYAVMKFVHIAVFFAFLILSGLNAHAQQQEEYDVYEHAENEADRLQKLLDLEDWQVFYVDSTLKHDFPALIADYDKLKASKVTSSAMYQAVQDKWMDQIDATYRRIFNDQQWAAYLKGGAGKAQKAREKRKAKAQGH
jgi:hypothetical protein